jgi:ATP-dependent DNA helicase RecG
MQELLAETLKSPEPAAGLRGLSPKVVEKFKKLGLESDQSLVLHLPLRYEDETKIISIRQAHYSMGQVVQVEGVVSSSQVQYRPRRQFIVTLMDASGQLVLRFLNFYPSLQKQFAEGLRLRVRGEMRQGFFGAEMVHPTHKVTIEGAPLPTVLTPVYSSSEGLSQTILQSAIARAMVSMNWSDTLSEEIVQSLGLMRFEAAVRLLHNPSKEVDEYTLTERTHPAWERMKFDELLAQQLSLKRSQAARRVACARPLANQGEVTQGLLASLPFSLTNAQQRVLSEIRSDMASPYPMQRLLQGDVGSGKTIIAALAAAQAIDSGYQVAFMAPTEILAEQHFQKIASLMKPLGVEVAWLTGSLKKKEKTLAREKIVSGQAQLIIGTHALIQDSVQFYQLGLVVVDEQHRFGVEQRLSLHQKISVNQSAAWQSHQLMMSATPIPRTLAMTYYADLEVSVIDELPPGRTPVMTRLLDQVRREEVIERVRAAVNEGRQVYWICPLIEESEALQLQTANEIYAALQIALPEVKVGLVHGRLKPVEKQLVMEEFANNRVQVLVATTVVEVGVDVPNASLMVIEHAERFGLSQLHQLRGRVGRGATVSACLLLYQSPLGFVAKQRLMIMREITDGFEIARRDLAIRGPGEFLGARQSGQAVLRFADLEKDQPWVEKARDCADKLLRNPSPENTAIINAHLARWLGLREAFLKV